MGLKPGLKGLTQKEKNHRRAHLQDINNISFAECDPQGKNIFYVTTKTNDLQKTLIEIGATFGENYLSEKNFPIYKKNSDMVADKIFSLIPNSFRESDFVKEEIDFLKKGINIGCRRKISGQNGIVDNTIICDKILDFMKNDTPIFIDSVSHEEVQNLILMGRHFNKKKMVLNSNMNNIWIMVGYYDNLYKTLNDILVSLKNKDTLGDKNEHKVR